MRYAIELKAIVDKDVLDKITELVNDDIHDKDLTTFRVDGVPEPDSEEPTTV